MGQVVKDTLSDDLCNFKAYERMSTDVSHLIQKCRPSLSALSYSVDQGPGDAHQGPWGVGALCAQDMDGIVPTDLTLVAWWAAAARHHGELCAFAFKFAGEQPQGARHPTGRGSGTARPLSASKTCRTTATCFQLCWPRTAILATSTATPCAGATPSPPSRRCPSASCGRDDVREILTESDERSSPTRVVGAPPVPGARRGLPPPRRGPVPRQQAEPSRAAQGDGSPPALRSGRRARRVPGPQRPGRELRGRARQLRGPARGRRAAGLRRPREPRRPDARRRRRRARRARRPLGRGTRQLLRPLRPRRRRRARGPRREARAARAPRRPPPRAGSTPCSCARAPRASRSTAWATSATSA